MNPEMRPSETIQKVLISSTSRFVGEFELGCFLLTHAWPSRRHSAAWARLEPGPVSRSVYMLSFETAPYGKAAGIVVPEYEFIGDTFCALLAVLFGKRFDAHGAVEMSGHYRIPDLSQLGVWTDTHFAFNSHAARADFPIQLNLGELRRFGGLVEGVENGTLWSDPKLRAFEGASRFYMRALQNAESDPEVAYLHLITAGEILAARQAVPDDRLVDAYTRNMLKQLRGVRNGERLATFVRSRLWQLKRRFVTLFEDFVDETFFNKREAAHEYEGLRQDCFAVTMGAAYDLRSKFVHTGIHFGGWVRPRRENAERQGGKPVVPDKEMAKILARAPTFVGLERVTRYVLLKYAIESGAEVNDAPQ